MFCYAEKQIVVSVHGFRRHEEKKVTKTVAEIVGLYPTDAGSPLLLSKQATSYVPVKNFQR